MFHSHVWYIACNLFCNVFYGMQANFARQRSGSSVAAAPAESSQAPPASSQSIAAKSLLDQHIIST